MVRRPSGCEVPNCDGAHIAEGLCHYGDGPFKAKGLCKGCYGKARRVYSERKTPAFHVLTPDDVREIRRLAASGIAQRGIADKFSVTGATVSKIVNRKSWNHVE